MNKNFYSLATIYLIDKKKDKIKNKEENSIIESAKLLSSIKKEIHKVYENMLKMGI